MERPDISYNCTPADEGLLVKEILRLRLKLSSHLLKKIKPLGGIMLNGERCGVRHRVKAGDVVSVRYPEETSYFEPQNIPLDIVYEDEDLLVVNKQAGLIVHPTHNFPDGTLANALAFRMQQTGEVFKPRFVNRLDMNTSGLLIVAKNAHCQDFLQSEMAANRVDKIYTAIVHGITEPSGTIDLPILKDPNHKARRMVSSEGYPSVTHFKTLETFDIKDTGQLQGYSIVEIKLDTGRTHQIRVHMTHIGHPLVGDELYAQLYGYAVDPEWMPRQALHAGALSFAHPEDGHLVSVFAKPPEDMRKCAALLRKMLVEQAGKE
ncbi:MAG: RluA family pseudouridine synthase [Firmicutes bacterium]|nr:RluA family pseudouridine synthase [Bacillota bacterium]